jgi:hypothetical protein
LPKQVFVFSYVTTPPPGSDLPERQVETSWGAGGDLIKLGGERKRERKGERRREEEGKAISVISPESWVPASASTKRERKQRQDRTKPLDARILKVESLLLF